MSEEKTSTFEAEKLSELGQLRKRAASLREDLSRSFWSGACSPALLFIGSWLLSMDDRRYGRYVTDLGGPDQFLPRDSSYIEVSNSTLMLLDVLGWMIVTASVVCFFFGIRFFLLLVDLWQVRRQISDEVASSTMRSGLHDLAQRFEPQVIETVREVPVIRAPEVVLATQESSTS